MNAARFARGLHAVAGPLVLVAALIIAFLAYAPGFSGTAHFDDAPNLDGLTQVEDPATAINYIASGIAGPSGRPLALASFVPQADAWPDAPEVLLRTNAYLHLLNGALVAWLLYLLGLARGSDARRAAWTASLSATIWMLLPILASSSLLIVQRMTLLSATFLLLGFVGYLYSRRLLETRPYMALGSMSACVLLGAGLAALAKENGVLLPLFVLVAEATLLPRPARAEAHSLRKLWSVIFLIVPAVALLAYLALKIPSSEGMLLKRGFTAPERMLTQAHILWEYLYHAFLPATSNLGPFHDDHALYTSWLHPLAIAAVGGWLAVCSAAVALRRRWPLLAFAVGWYVAGHLLESTSLSLELYFEHRNYVPLIGPVFAFVAAATAVPQWHALARAGLLAYSAMLAVVLASTTSLWGKPALAAEIWAIHHPDSARATQYLVERLEKQGDERAARRVLQRYLDTHPDVASMQLHVLLLSCLLEPERPLDTSLERIEANLRNASFEHGVFDRVRMLRRVAKDRQCDSITPDVVYELAQATAANPAYRAVPVAYHNLHILMAEHTVDERDLDRTMSHIEAALSVHYVMPSLRFAIDVLTSAGLVDEARKFIDDARERQPQHPLRAAIWERQLARLESAVDAYRSARAERPDPASSN